MDGSNLSGGAELHIGPSIRGPTVDPLWINMEAIGEVCIRVECPFRGGSVEPIFNLSYEPGTMKFVISDLENPYIQMEKVWHDFS